MPIGRGLSKKRPRNDLDDYLDEVDSLLFCVTRADRQCLNRDLKAHIKELTTDPSKSDIYMGRYQITKEQLEADIGIPKVIASNYIFSVGKKIPSLGLRLYMVIIIGIFLSMTVVGIDWINLTEISNVEEPEWLRFSGTVLALAGLTGLFLSIISTFKFQKLHIILIYLVILALVLSVPFSSVVSNAVIWAQGGTTEPLLHRVYSGLFLLDFIIIGLIGVYLYLRHFKVFNPQADLTI